MTASSRAGRDMSQALAVGVVLAVLVVGSLVTYRPAFVVVVAAAVVVAVGELAHRLHLGTMAVPLVVGAPVLPVMAYWRGPHDAIVAFLVYLLVVAGWRIQPVVSHGAFQGDGSVTRDLGAGVLTVVYVPFLAMFITLVLAQHEGDLRVLTWLGCVVFSDIGGFAVGVLTGGRHKMIPVISPGKSWEGLVGSLVFASVWGSLFMAHALGEPWEKGIVLGSIVTVAAVAGDLLESAIKRDLGVKDMGNLLPGHGGMLDRVDSILVAAPVSWAVLGALL